MSILWLVLGAIYLALFFPFWKPILLGWIFALALSPLVERLRRKFAIPRVRSAYGLMGTFISFTLIILIVMAIHVYTAVAKTLTQPESMNGLLEFWQGFRDKVIGWIAGTRLIPSAQVRLRVEESFALVSDEARQFVLNLAQTIIREAPDILLKMLIFFLAFGIFLVAGQRLFREVAERLKLNPDVRQKYKEMEIICGRSLASIFLVGAIQAILATVGALIAGYQAWATIFVVTFCGSLIPVVGAGSVPMALSFYALVSGSWSEVVILLVTTLVVGISDNLARAWLFSRASNIHPVISLMSLIGAIQIFGIAGLFFAPVLEQLVMAHFFNENV